MSTIVSKLVLLWAAVLAAALPVALFDAMFVSDAGVLSALLASYSLLALYSVAVTLVVLALSWMLAGQVGPAVQSPGVFWPCAAAAFVSWLLLSARTGRGLLVGEAPPLVVGAAMALAALSLAWVHFSVVQAVAAQLVARPGLLALSPNAGKAVGLAIAGGAFVVLVLTGETSGAGSAVDMLGVMRREELDLRGAMLGTLWVLGATALGWVGQRRRGLGWHSAVLLAAFASAVLGYRSWSDDVTVAVRRSAPLTKVLLGPVWRVSDRDEDGFSAVFGGGDCDDHDAARFPTAHDEPGNGVDEDCSGSDESLVAAPVREAPKTEVAAGREKLPPNLDVVLITIDTLRADLGYMGYARPISPNLDALVARSVLFENGYALASYTGKSLGPTLIGRYPSENHRNFGHFDRFSSKNVFLQERLKAVGIRTISVQGHWYMKEDTGLGRGFDVLDMSAAPRVPQAEGDRTVNSDKLTDAAIARLAEVESGQRFFLWVHYLDPHAEYVPHEEHNFGRKGRDLYDGEIAYTDRHIGRLLDAIANGPRKSTTAIIVTSDHGEAFGEHGLIRHGFELWEELIRVPLIVHVPGVPAKREPARRGLIDLAPTVLELYGLPLPAAGAEDFLSGESWVPDLLRPAGEPSPARPVFADMCGGPYNDERQALIEDDIKIITAMGRPVGIYDLKKDPGEKENLLNQPLREEMKQKLASFRSRLKVVPAKR